MIRPERIHTTKGTPSPAGNIVYWMNREHRTLNNWGLVYAQQLQKMYKSEIAVVVTLPESFAEKNPRQAFFLIQGLKEVEAELRNLNIPFYFLPGNPGDTLSSFCLKHKAFHVVTDFNPLNSIRKWQKVVRDQKNLKLYEVDSHNIVPARFVSQKQEFGAYTIRPKIKKRLEYFLDPFPEIIPQTVLNTFHIQHTNWNKILNNINTHHTVKPADWLESGQTAANNQLSTFISKRLHKYDELRNKPEHPVLSDLSPYLHFGQISTQYIAIQLLKQNASDINTQSFLEELIIRKELSDNYCHHNPSYDTLDNLPEWSAKTLDTHKNDIRDYIYNPDDFEKAKTGDPLWNAAQNEMIMTGKMHGYMRMYWAKKILEWSETPEIAMETAVRLNDKYELDGNDPNGYTGCAWAIGGVHDRAWKERPVFGKIRYMNYNGAKRKFDVNSYISRWNSPGLL